MDITRDPQPRLQEPHRRIHALMPRPNLAGHRRVFRARNHTRQVLVARIALVAVQHESADADAPTLKPLLLAEGGVRFPPRRVGAREGPLGAHDGVALGGEEEVWPCEEPEEGQVEEPADPRLEPPFVDARRGVDVQGAVLDRERDADVAAVVGAADQALDAVFEQHLVKPSYGAVETEAGLRKRKS